MRIISFKIERDLAERLEALAKKMRVSRSELIRMAIRKYIQETEQGPCKPFVTRRIRIC